MAVQTEQQEPNSLFQEKGLSLYEVSFIKIKPGVLQAALDAGKGNLGNMSL